MLDKTLRQLLVCPICKGNLDYQKKDQELICQTDQLAYPIRDDIPVMLPEEARTLSTDAT
jgi:uncharacterized protein YbaR (Trm112 family)